MRKTNIAILMFIVALFSVISCDKIESERYNIINNEDITVSFTELDKNSVYRKVLIEEYTGHRCTNCPAGHAVLNNLHERYGDTLVMMGIHFGALANAFGETFSYNFKTEVGNMLGQYYVIDGIPAAIVNRNFKSGGWQREQWPTVVAEIDRSKVFAAIQMINQYNESDKSLKANCKITMLADYPNSLYLGLFVIEDDIVKPQKDGTETIMEYTHNHVFRGSFTDNYTGVVLNQGNLLSNGNEIEYASTISLNNTDWNADNCSVVAVLFDPANDEVIQVESLKFK